MIQEVLVLTSMLITLDVFYILFIGLSIIIYIIKKPKESFYECVFINKTITGDVEWKFFTFMVLCCNMIYSFGWLCYYIFNLIS